MCVASRHVSASTISMIFFVAQSPNACLDKSKPRVIVQRRQLLRYGASDTFIKNCVVDESVCLCTGMEQGPTDTDRGA